MEMMMGTNHEISATLTAATRTEVADPAPAPPKPPITLEQFDAVEMRVGEIVSAKPVPNKDKLVHLIVDFGAHGVRVVVAGILKSWPDPKKLVGERYVFVTNLAPRKIGGFESQAMLLAAPQTHNPDLIALISAAGAAIGARVG
jgi:methionyl-tRNA synthetase